MDQFNNELIKPLDDIDRKILDLLQKDAEMTHKQIAALLNRSITPIRGRIKKLKESGYIRRFTVLVDPEKIGKGLIAYTQVTITKHTQRSLLDFQAQVVQLPEVMECYHMNGTYDFLLRIVIKDMHEYSTVLMAKLSQLTGVVTMHTFFVMAELKYETAYKLSESKAHS
jgi:Lrp/AsnC family leucine-responsive transcriptional regulator